MTEHLLVVGAGQAAIQAVQSARQNGYDGRVTILGAETHAPYQRPPLSKAYLAGDLPRERLSLKPEQFFETRGIDLRRGARVASIDPANRTVRLADDEELGFSQLLLATGSSPRLLDLPGSGLAGIHYLRTIDDVEAIRPRLDVGARLLLVGGGYIGLEVAAVAVRSGCSVTLVEAAPATMTRSVCRTVSDFFVDRHRLAGVDLHVATDLARFVGDDSVHFAETVDGERFECDLAIVAVGIEPSTTLAADAGLAIDNGIAVDACGRTSLPDVFAAGDCTSHPHPWVGRRIRLESVQNAIEQGKAAGAAVCGISSPFDAVPWFWSDQYDLKLQIAGLAGGHDRTVLRGRPADGSFTVFYLGGERVVAAASVNDPRNFVAARNRLAARPRWPVDALADADCDLNDLDG